ncbi:MAG: hypothetical protein AMJ62_01030 [Myxococcales bacterium SG8_38]|nr:MAG: hypothetical protein AMJ62_01030 [Myxococcales bacterium SG8_38]
MVNATRLRCVVYAALIFAALGSPACSGSSDDSDGTDGTGGTAASAGNGGNGGQVGTGGTGGAGGSAGIGGEGGIGGTEAQPKEQEVLLVGGFMSELYEALSLHLEDEINAALRNAARSLNVHIDLPLNQSIDIAIGDAIASALPWFDLPIQPGGFVTFHAQELYFDAEGIAYQNLSKVSPSFDTSESVEHNADAILEFLRNTDKQIVIVSHSKGGLDTLEALLDAPELWGETVAGWVALQAPFYGSPVADPSPSAINAVLLSAVGGNGESLDDLKTTTRTPYMDAREAQIAALSASVPIISAYSTYEATGTVTGFATTFANSILNAALISQITQIVIDNYWETPLDIPGIIARSTAEAVNLLRTRVADALSDAVATLGLMDLTNLYMSTVVGVPNDGLVPRDSTLLTGAIHRQLTLGDHASPVMDVDPMKNFWTVDHRNAVTIGLIHEIRTVTQGN